MSDQEIIENRIRKLGGRLDCATLSDILKSTYEEVKFRSEKSIEFITKQLNNLNIDFDVIDDYSFNAIAIGINQNHFIGINRGTIATLSLVFNRLLADRNVLEFIGDPSKEKEDLPLLENISRDFIVTTEILPLFLPPQCPVRMVFSNHMTKMAIDFILAHEIGHIISGHVAFSQSKFGLTNDELSLIANSEIENKLARKTMEMDADSWATTILLSSELNRVVGKNQLPGKEWADFYRRPGMVLTLFTFVVSTIYKLFDDNRLDEPTFRLASYPSLRLRCFISLLAIKSNLVLKEINKNTIFELDKFGIPISISAAFSFIETSFEIITGKKSLTQSIDDAWGDREMDQINQLVDYWNTYLINELSNVSYVKIHEKEKITIVSGG